METTPNTWDGHERRQYRDALEKILLDFADLRTGQREMRHSLKCLKEVIEPFQPMLEEMLANRDNYRKLRFNVMNAAAIGLLSVIGSFGLFVVYLISEWAKGAFK